jgi:sugar-specific transcriptional regulator TrmB
VYLALVQLGRAKAGEIYKNAGVARQDVYRILEKLQEIGLVEKSISRPFRFSPTPFCSGLTILIERKHAQLEELKKKVEKIKDKVFVPTISEHDVLSHGMAVTLDEHILALKTKSKFETAKQSIEYVCKWDAFVGGSIKTLKESRMALRRGVKAKTIIERPRNSLIVPKPLQKLMQEHVWEVRMVDSIPFISLGIIDKKELIFAPLPQTTKETNTYWTKNSGFVELANKYFETSWNKADSFDPHAIN